MVEGGSFNITNTVKPTNQDIVVAFSPASNIKSYTYYVYKDNSVLNSMTISTNQPVNIPLIDTGNYQVVIKLIDNQNQQLTVNSGTYVIDKMAPVIEASDVQIKKGDVLPKVYVKDNLDGDITDKVISSDIDLNQSGTQILTYTALDEAGNMATKSINVNIKNDYLLFSVQAVAIILFFLLVYIIVNFFRGVSLAKRIDPFIIKSLNNNDLSLFDFLTNAYRRKLEKWEKSFGKSVVLQKYAKHLDKYKNISLVHKNGTQIIITKIILAFVVLLIAIIVKAIQFKTMYFHQILFPLLVGFFMIDIIYFIKYKVYKNRLENELLSAIIIMNNAFKSGRNIIQAIDIVSRELNGRMAKEFSKMSLELSYGLEIDIVFKRLYERIKLEEIKYLTASLTILNKTGGNIIEVFSSIEKTLFNKKKLRIELKSLTASSRIIVYVLFTVPFLFVLFVSVISPGYFMPFITNDLGRILLLGMIIYYILFIVCVRRIMKVVI